MKACIPEMIHYKQIISEYPRLEKFYDYFFDSHSAAIFTSEDKSRVLITMIFKYLVDVRFIIADGKLIFVEIFNHTCYHNYDVREYYSIDNTFFHVKNLVYRKTYEILMIGIEKKHHYLVINDQQKIASTVLFNIKKMYLRARIVKLII